MFDLLSDSGADERSCASRATGFSRAPVSPSLHLLFSHISSAPSIGTQRQARERSSLQRHNRRLVARAAPRRIRHFFGADGVVRGGARRRRGGQRSAAEVRDRELYPGSKNQRALPRNGGERRYRRGLGTVRFSGKKSQAAPLAERSSHRGSRVLPPNPGDPRNSYAGVAGKPGREAFLDRGEPPLRFSQSPRLGRKVHDRRRER